MFNIFLESISVLGNLATGSNPPQFSVYSVTVKENETHESVEKEVLPQAKPKVKQELKFEKPEKTAEKKKKHKEEKPKEKIKKEYSLEAKKKIKKEKILPEKKSKIPEQELILKVSPPIIARANGAYCSLPASNPKAIGIMPSSVASEVIRMGRRRTLHDSTTAALSPIPRW